MRMVSRSLALLLLLSFASTLPGRAEESQWLSVFSPAEPFRQPPSWITPLTENAEARIFGEARFRITPIGTAEDLLVTVTFNEKTGGFLKVFWASETGSQTLSDNLYEGIGMPNQRSLLIPRALLEEKGILTLRSSQEDLEVHKILWQWMEPKLVAAAGEGLNVAAVDANGKSLAAVEVTGDPLPQDEDRWKTSFVTAPLIEQPERIEEGIEFEFQLEADPQWIRLEGCLSGLPLDRTPTIWVNGRPITASLEVPDLTDPGYIFPAEGAPGYVGWRKVQMWLPAAYLEPGLNKLQFSWGNREGENFPVAVKSLSLQLNYKPSSLPPPAQAPAAEAVPAALDPLFDLGPLPVR